MGKHPGYEYRIVDIELELVSNQTIRVPMFKAEEIANRYAAEGWRVVGIYPPHPKVHEGALMLERIKQNPFSKLFESDNWHTWQEEHAGPWLGELPNA